MGRNDTGRMVNFSTTLNTSAKQCLSSLLALCFVALLIFNFIIYDVNAQSDPIKGKKSEFTFKVLQRYTAPKPYVYHYTQRDTVVRVFSDESKKVFFRDVDYFFTILAESSPKDGFIYVTVSIDSMMYKIKDGDAEFFYDSRDDFSSSGIEFDDMEYYNVPMGRMFEMNLSPYGEVGGFSSESLDWIRDYVTVQGKGRISDKKMFLWTKGLSDEMFAHIADVRKLEVPLGFLKIDTTWASPLSMEVGSLSFTGDVNAQLADYETANIFISTTLDSLECFQEKAVFYGINELVDIVAADVKGSLNVVINHLGAVDVATIKANMSATAKIKKEIFTENVYSEMKWTLLGRYKY